MPSSNVYLLAFVQWPRKEVQMTKISAHIYFPFLQMDFFLPYQLLLEQKIWLHCLAYYRFGNASLLAKAISPGNVRKWDSITNAFVFCFYIFFGPKKAQFIMNAASRNRDLEISGAKTLTQCLLSQQEEWLKSVSNHCGCIPRGVRSVKRSEIL